MMKRLLWLAFMVLALAGCREKEEPEPYSPAPPTEVEQTIIVFMPWSTNLLPYFLQNLIDLEEAMRQEQWTNRRFLVCLANSNVQAELMELTVENGRSVRSTLRQYQQPDYTQADQIRNMLEEVTTLAPARNYSLIIGCHGMAWLPAGEKPSRHDSPAKLPISQNADEEQDEEIPLTRWFGGSANAYQIEISTLAEAIESAGMHMEYILFDDCYMSSVEVAYELKDVTDYLIGCPTEIMNYGFPYHRCAPFLVTPTDYEQLCQSFLDFYSTYTTPCGTIAVTDCREMESLAEVVKEINQASETDNHTDNVQSMDGYSPTVFFDFGDYIQHICPNTELWTRFQEQMKRTVPHKAHTPRYYSSADGYHDINAFSGLTTSASSTNRHTAQYGETKWAKRVSKKE